MTSTLDLRRAARDAEISNAILRGGDRRPLLVGEDNPYQSPPAFDLWPEPVGCAGWRLCTKILGLSEIDYLERFRRVNLCRGGWSDVRARARAAELQEAALPEDLFVLLGRKVARAFDPGSGEAFTRYRVLLGGVKPLTYCFLPHPSGRSRVWNDPTAIPRVRALLAGLLP